MGGSKEIGEEGRNVIKRENELENEQRRERDSRRKKKKKIVKELKEMEKGQKSTRK